MTRRDGLRRHLLRRRSLRTRLTALLAFLLLLGAVASAAATAVAVRRIVLSRLDNQITAAGSRYATALEHDTDNDHDADNAGTQTIGQPVGTLGARIKDDRLTQVGVISDRTSAVTVTPAARAELVTASRTTGIHTVALNQLGRYRLLVAAGRDGDVLITGLPQRPVEQTTEEVVLAELVIYACVVVVVILLGAWAVRRSLRPLEVVSRTALQVSELPLGSGRPTLEDRVVVADGDDTEIGRVARSVNLMLERIEGALTQRADSEDLLRRFVADAGHELRTPLAVVRSHNDLISQQGNDLPADVRASLDRIDEETRRMSELVDELLLLARLDAGTELAHEPVDLSVLCLETVADAHVLAPDHRWLLDLPEDPVQVDGDGTRLRQVLTNLLSNARTHTPAGTQVVVALAVPGDVVVTVTDDGPGIPAGVLPSVRERFVRGDTGRTRSSGSTGLGLAIVDAVIAAHGGTVDIASDERGTTVSVTLPARLLRED